MSNSSGQVQQRSGKRATFSSSRTSNSGIRDSLSILQDRSRALLKERDAQIAALELKVNALTSQLATASKDTSKRSRPLTPYTTTVRESISKTGSNRRYLLAERAAMGRNASLTTRNALKEAAFNERRNTDEDGLVKRIMDMFKEPSAHMDYLKSLQFAKDLMRLNHKVRHLLEKEPRVAFLQSPAYIFGDIHGNLEDLHFFSDNIWRLGMALTAGNFVFLGDYVDRGRNCLEVVAYLLAMKVQLPHKVFLLRGNHETRDVNGWEEHYGDRSFIYQCRERFGDDLGYRLWEQCNQVFDRMPLAAVVDQDIFCVHGGIPRPCSSDGRENENGSSRIQDILTVPRVAGINPPYEHEGELEQQVASDCIWSDPASDEQEATGVDPETGFGESLRGGGAICFGHKAVTDFLDREGLSYIMRAHEAHAEGVAVSKGARVFTVFSTSKDHNQGNQAMAGCILVDFEKMQVINRSPAYRNQYVHRRGSTSLINLNEREIAQRMKLGLVEPEDFPDDEEWDDFESESDEEEDENYVIDTRRKSSVDATHTVTSPPGSSHDNHDRHGSNGSAGSYGRGLEKHYQDSTSSIGSLGRGDLARFPSITEVVDESDADQEDAMEVDHCEVGRK